MAIDSDYVFFRKLLSRDDLVVKDFMIKIGHRGANKKPFYADRQFLIDTEYRINEIIDELVVVDVPPVVDAFSIINLGKTPTFYGKSLIKMALDAKEILDAADGNDRFRFIDPPDDNCLVDTGNKPWYRQGEKRW